MTMKTRLLTIIHSLILLGLTGAFGAEFDSAHLAWNRLVATGVHEGMVDYATIQGKPAELNTYLNGLAAVTEVEFKSWKQPEQLAFLINLYNASTVKMMVDHYPVTSIKKIGSVWKGPWKQEVVHLWGKTVTLDHLEHEVIRPGYPDPRVHFALVCAAKGCPSLRSEAYIGSRLDDQLNDQARRFLSTREKNRIDSKERTVYLSPIFKWYAGDFEAKSGSVLEAIQPFWPASQTIPSDLAQFKIRYTDYDWSLNEKPR